MLDERVKRRSFEYAILFSAVYGIIDELHQSLIPGRSCDILDWIADILGAFLSFFVYKYLIKPNTVIQEKIQ